MRDIHPARPTPPRQHRAGNAIAREVGAAALAGVGVIALAQAVLAGRGPALMGATCVFLLASLAVAMLMRRAYPHDRIGACNVVTLGRTALVCALLAPLLAGHAAGWAVAGVAGLALALDGVDGRLARQSRLVSRFGARFDIEVDATLALVLSLHLLAGTAAGPQILVLGLTRYAFVLAGLRWPWLQADLPERRWRKAICVMQLSVLILLQTPLPGPAQAEALGWLTALALVCSFAADVLWLWRQA